MHKVISMHKFFNILSFFLVLSFSVNAAEVDPLFGDTIDRTAEDFVIVSLCIADPTDWKEDVIGVTGHAFLRLQCPVFNLDYCFSYEGENVNDNLFRYLSGKTKMGMFAVPTEEYLEDYKRWNRSVHEYFLDLPPQTEQRLWEIMDNHITGGITLRQDLNKYGCAITVVRYVKQALLDIPILAGRGPRISVRMESVGSSSARFENTFTSAGINQTNHRIVLHIDVSVAILLPGFTTATKVSNAVTVAETVIVGTAPETYTYFSANPENGIDDQKDYVMNKG